MKCEIVTCMLRQCGIIEVQRSANKTSGKVESLSSDTVIACGNPEFSTGIG